MTENYDKITAEYRDADFNHRLSLYLQYPQLRSDFILIDQNDLTSDLSTGSRLRENFSIAQISMVLGLVAGSAKKFIGIASA
jgi:hypothetical protein